MVPILPAFRAQRHLPSDPLARMTIPDILPAIQSQTQNLFLAGDFIPVPCCMPSYNFVTYALLDGDRVTPLTRVLEVDRYLDYLKNRTMPGLNDELLKILDGCMIPFCTYNQLAGLSRAGHPRINEMNTNGS